ncbi:hypothetical protein RGE_02670 [Rubrivivax gelatinosus IL144]|uniref:Uncharacterized protein n=1 Tax=Rubrivivax gelatinosus (strain NBRC 100245 / IL144) TaxID=983917 RepID=I0HKS5_RUBGI|nr:hypothetical protein RGE_02670 [Rubrivivax gelatinosus IL144]
MSPLTSGAPGDGRPRPGVPMLLRRLVTATRANPRWTARDPGV